MCRRGAFSRVSSLKAKVLALEAGWARPVGRGGREGGTEREGQRGIEREGGKGDRERGREGR